MGHNHSLMRLSRGLWSGGIRRRLAAVILLAMTPLIGFRIIELRQEREHQIEAAGLRAREVARHAAELYREPVVEAQALLQVLALVPEVTAGSAESCAAFLERAGRDRSWAQSFWVIDRGGRVVCTTVPQGLGRDVSDRDYVRRPIETGEFMVSDVFVGRARGTLTSMAALPVRDGDGRVGRVISVAIRLSWLGRLAAEIGAEHGASVRLIDGRGTVFARYPEPTAHAPSSDESELAGKALAASDGVAEIVAPDGSRRIYAFVQIPGTQARIAIGFDRAQVLARVDAEIRKAAVALVLATLIAALAGTVLARGIVRPLKLLTAGAEAARSIGTASLPPVRGYAEVTSLAASLAALLTDLKRREEELRSTRSFLDTVIENLPTMLFVKDARDDRFVLVNRAGEDLLGAPRQEVIGRHSHDLFPAAEADRFVAHDRKVIETGVLDILDETEMHTPGNGTRTLRIKKIAVPDEQGRPQYVLGICEDITERKRSEARLSHMARHDALTGLPNRVLFRERLARALDRGGALAVLYVDLDAFKDVNDALGHPIGDALLRLVAERLRASVREADTVARLGGDEFAIVAAGGAAEAAGALARAVIDLLSEPYQVEGQDVVIGASIGIVLAPADGSDADRLLKNADMALYQAKADGRATWRFFDPGMEARQQSRRSIELDLRAALPKRQFTIHYQPAIDLATSTISGFEALLRWQHPQRGMIAPDEFIPLAEDIGLIVPLGEWVLRQACEEAVHWPDDIRVAVNLSAAQFRSRNLVQTVVMALAASGLPPRRLELEITETVLLRENDANLAVLHQLRGLGVRIALDDFGTGYSSLSYLRSFPFDKIKIDRSFVRDLPDNPGCRTIIRSVAELASGLGMVTTAEGVETLHQMNELRVEGCTEAQGFLFSPPRPASQVREILTKFRGAVEAAA
jgi:diguanylate cyclase (GGDEF)-like protein/PAS domain S-box-containing protein